MTELISFCVTIFWCKLFVEAVFTEIILYWCRVRLHHELDRLFPSQEYNGRTRCYICGMLKGET